MKYEEIQNKAESLMLEHGLDNWTFKWNNRRRSLGVCFYNRKQIQLSRFWIKLVSYEKIIDTILHEIAHALVGFKHGHNHIWRAKAREIGANPNRCYQHDLEQKEMHKVMNYKYKRYCPNCEIEEYFSRLGRNKKEGACGKCCDRFNNGRWSEKYQFVIIKLR